MKDKHSAKVTKESGPKRPQKVKRAQHEQICVEKRFTDLLHLIDHLGNNIRPTTAGNKHSLQMVKHLISCTQNVIRDCSKGVEKNMNGYSTITGDKILTKRPPSSPTPQGD